RHQNYNPMKRIQFLFICLFLFALPLKAQESIEFKIEALSKNPDNRKEKERLDQLADLYFEFKLLSDPELNIPTRQTEWRDFSDSGIKRRRDGLELLSKAVKSIDRSGLGREDQLNYDVLKNTIEIENEGEKFPYQLMPITNNLFSSYHQRIVNFSTRTAIQTNKDVDDFLIKLGKIPKLIDQLIGLMDKGIEMGIMPSKASLKGVPDQLQNMRDNDLFLSNLNAYLSKKQTAYSEEITDKAMGILSGSVFPAFEKLQSYMEKSYIPNARESVGWKDIPDGESWYNYRIKVETTTSLPFHQIHEIGLREVKRIRAEMDSLIQSTGFTGSFDEFNTFLRTDPRFFFEEPAQLLDAYRAIAKKIDPELPKMFGKLPRMPYGVFPVPEIREKYATTAYYSPSSASSGRAGIFYANTYDLMSRPKWEMEALTIHEAMPGHHLQISLAQEMEDVPEFRKYVRYTAFSEGWGLYSESLGDEMGFYKDPYSKFGQLTYEMWRAIRLVVDTGIHGMGWSRQEAIDYFKGNSAKTEHDITVEIDRYIAWPAQALAYKVGELKIKELRAAAEQQLGEKFDIRMFHDELLSFGALPLSILEERMREWIISLK
uniref:DUF885 domain-containing protein n=1 Tax=Aquiflexum sp. TaxID=1872584 RepID=UPI00359378D5